MYYVLVFSFYCMTDLEFSAMSDSLHVFRYCFLEFHYLFKILFILLHFIIIFFFLSSWYPKNVVKLFELDQFQFHAKFQETIKLYSKRNAPIEFRRTKVLTSHSNLVKISLRCLCHLTSQLSLHITSWCTVLALFAFIYNHIFICASYYPETPCHSTVLRIQNHPI